MYLKKIFYVVSFLSAFILFLLYTRFFSLNSRISWKSISADSPRFHNFHSGSPQSHPAFAIATFLTGQVSNDHYFNLTRLLTYQFLYAPETRIEDPNIHFVVFCGIRVPEKMREILRKDGATVIGFEDVVIPPWIQTPTERWTEQFTKLRIFEQTQYSHILYLDADYLIMNRMDGIFNEPNVADPTKTLFQDRADLIKEDEEPLPEEWLFAARPENGGMGGYNHPVPPLNGDYANGGFLMIAPQQGMFDYLMRVLNIKDRFKTQFMEQDLLNYVFSRKGPMPWRELHWKWSSNFVNQRDVDAGVHALHGKFWEEGPEYVQKRWQDTFQKMIERDAARR